MAAQRLECELVTESDLDRLIATQFGDQSQTPGQTWRPFAASILASVGLDHRHVVLCCTGAEMLARDLPAVFRLHVVAPESVRLANLVADRQLSRAAAKTYRRKMVSANSQLRKRRFGQRTSPATSFDLVLNAQAMGPA